MHFADILYKVWKTNTDDYFAFNSVLQMPNRVDDATTSTSEPHQKKQWLIFEMTASLQNDRFNLLTLTIIPLVLRQWGTQCLDTNQAILLAQHPLSSPLSCWVFHLFWRINWDSQLKSTTQQVRSMWNESIKHRPPQNQSVLLVKLPHNWLQHSGAPCARTQRCPNTNTSPLRANVVKDGGTVRRYRRAIGLNGELRVWVNVHGSARQR